MRVYIRGEAGIPIAHGGVMCCAALLACVLVRMRVRAVRRRSRVTLVCFVAGKSVNSKDALEEKKDDSDLWETQAAFLGPNLWDKTLPYDPDLKVQEVSTRYFITYCVLCASRLYPPPPPRPLRDPC